MKMITAFNCQCAVNKSDIICYKSHVNSGFALSIPTIEIEFSPYLTNEHPSEIQTMRENTNVITSAMVSQPRMIETFQIPVLAETMALHAQHPLWRQTSILHTPQTIPQPVQVKKKNTFRLFLKQRSEHMA